MNPELDKRHEEALTWARNCTILNDPLIVYETILSIPSDLDHSDFFKKTVLIGYIIASRFWMKLSSEQRKRLIKEISNFGEILINIKYSYKAI